MLLHVHVTASLSEAVNPMVNRKSRFSNYSCNKIQKDHKCRRKIQAFLTNAQFHVLLPHELYPYCLKEP